MRKRLFEIIELSKDGDTVSNVYDMSMLVVIICSLIPLAFKTVNPVFDLIEKIATGVFIFDYLARWCTADYKLQKGRVSFPIYPFTFSAIIDLLAILPSFNILAGGFRLLKVLRLLRVLRVLRVFKAFKYSKSISIIVSVAKREKNALVAVGILALGYILICALIIFNVEPKTFSTYYDAVYWATVSLTTVGYGDIYPVSMAGRFITMISSVVGIAIVALPAGIITAGYLDELRSKKQDDGEKKL